MYAVRSGGVAQNASAKVALLQRALDTIKDAKLKALYVEKTASYPGI
jgi:hypothetical protein